MSIGISYLRSLEYLKNVGIIILFLWISLFPQPIQDRYMIYVRIFIGALLAVLLLNKKYLKNLFSLQDLSLWLFLICLSSGIVSAIYKSAAFGRYLYLTTTFFILFYIGKALFFYKEDRDMVVKIICICSGLVALIGILELYFGKNILYENFIDNPYYERYVKYSSRLMSTQLNPAVLGSYLLGCLPFSFYLLKDASVYKRLSGIFSLLLSISVIILTFSRGVFLGLVALLLFYFWKMRKKKLAAAFLLFLVFLLAICPYFKNTNLRRFGFERFIAGSQDSIVSEYRLSRVKMTFRMLKDYPLFGVGLNNFRIRFNEYCDGEDRGRETSEFMIPDNMYLILLAETGLAGAIGFLIFISFLFKSGFRKMKESDVEGRYLLLVVISSLIGLLVNMGAYELFYWNNPYMLFCLLCGFIYGFGKSTRGIEEHKSNGNLS